MAAAAAATNRDAFLKRLEGAGGPLAPGDENHSPAVNDETMRFLKDAGIESVPIDPISLEALKNVIGKRKKHPAPSAPEEEPPAKKVTFDERKSPAVVEQVQTTRTPLKPSMSDITMMSGIQSIKTEQSVAGSALSEGGGTDQMILQQLQIQTQMILQMQQQIDTLTNVVNQMANDSSLAPNDNVRQLFRSPHQFAAMHPQVIPPRDARQAAVEEPPAVAEPPPRMFLFDIYDSLAGIPAYIRQTRFAQVWHVFWSLHARNVRLELGLVVKICLIVAVLSGKMMSRKRNYTGDFWTQDKKLYFIIVLVSVGFMIQTGYARFLYRFFVKEDIATRIYNGEDIDPNELNWERPAAAAAARGRDRAPAPAAAGNNNFFPQNLLGGNIPIVEGPFNIIKDVIILLGSFVLSLLPMWVPERPPPPQPPADAPLPDEQNGPGPAAVAPPADLDDFAADSDDEDEQGER